MEGARSAEERGGDRALAEAGDLRPEQGMKAIKRLEAEMYRHARNLEFEEAARIRDQIERLRQATFGVTARAGRLTCGTLAFQLAPASCIVRRPIMGA